MRKVRTRDGTQRHEPYPLSEFTEEVIQSVSRSIVHLKAVGHADLSGEQFSQMFADAISGQSHGQPLGIADVSWNGCCWSIKTVKRNDPHGVARVRLISGRNSPVYSSDISDPFADIQATGQSVLDIYNERINTARQDHSDIRLLVLIRNMASREFTLFERPIIPYAVNNYRWETNTGGNFEGYEGDRHLFTWQPHGSQFTIIEPVPEGATRFRITKEPRLIEAQDILDAVEFTPDWVETL